ncbi:glycosyltransferase [Kitasatospora terrestris]|uniref:Glycosyltransferase n=1 Tax=Kitasatospora terrestris TaxID=258051 RepID=A0ABP9EB65_9ACTN
MSPLSRRTATTAGATGRSATTAPPEAPAASRGRRAAVYASYALLPLSVGLWLLALRNVPLDRMGDLGLLQVLPPLYWVAVGLLTVGFALSLANRRTRTGQLTGYVLGLIAMIHATPTLLYPTLRYAWAWKHVAVVDAMIRHNGPVPDAQGFEIYNQWPGFFVLSGLLLRVTGEHSILGFAAWAPPVTNALLLAPLLLLYRAVTRNRTLVWGAVWIFYSCSWVGQDYFAPQAFAFLLYVTVIALVVRRLPARSSPGGGGADPMAARHGADPSKGHGLGILLVPVFVLEAVIASSHQLTPVMLVAALLGLAIPRRNRRTVLPALAGALVLTVLWDLTVARPYLAANIHSLVDALLSPDGNLVSGFVGLGAAAPGQVLVAWIDRGLSAAVFGLALLCVIRRPWVRHTAVPILAVAPLPLVVANPYGGEMVFRAYLVALPSTAFLIAALLLPAGPHPKWRAAVAVTVSAALLGGLFFGYYSKEAMNYFTTQEAEAVRRAVATAPPGALVVTLSGTLPGAAQDYDLHPRNELFRGTPDQVRELSHDPLSGIFDSLQNTPPGVPAYLILTRGQAAETYLTGLLPADTIGRMQQAADLSRRFTVVYRNDDAVVYRFVPNPVPAGSTGGG